jgi:hypothetical protein
MLNPSDLAVGQEVRIFEGGSRAKGGAPGEVKKIGRKLVTIAGPYGRDVVFRLDTQASNDEYVGRTWFRTTDQVADGA